MALAPWSSMSARTAFRASRLPWTSLRMAIMGWSQVALKVFRQLQGGGVTFGRVAAQAAQTDGVQVGRRWLEAPRRRRRGGDSFAPSERRPPGEQFVQDGAQAPDVGGGAQGGPALHLLRR